MKQSNKPKQGDGLPNKGGDKTANLPNPDKKRPIATKRQRYSRRGQLAHPGTRPGSGAKMDEKPKGVVDTKRAGSETGKQNFAGPAAVAPKRGSRYPRRNLM